MDKYAAGVVLALLCVEVAISALRGRSVYGFPDTVSNISLLAVQRLSHYLLDPLFLALYWLLYEHARLLTLKVDTPWAIAALVVAIDFVFYWYHRFSHRVNFAWAAHAVHHQSEYFNLSVGLRISTTSIPIHWMFHYPFALAGVPPLTFFAVYAASTIYQVWYHAAAQVSLGPLDRILVTPANHSLHHAQNPAYIDCNYGGIFSVWDRLFGSYRQRTEPPRFGVLSPPGSLNPFRVHLHGYQRLVHAARGREGMRARLWLFFQPPEALPAAGEAMPRPQVARPLRIYAVLALLLAAAEVISLSIWRHSLPLGVWLVLALPVFMGAACVPGLLENSDWAWRLERARHGVCIVLLCAVLAAGANTFAQRAVCVALAAWHFILPWCLPRRSMPAHAVVGA